MNSRLDVYIWPEGDKDPVVADNSAIRRLRQLADGYRASDYGGNRLRTHLILKNQALVNVLRRVPLDPDMAADIELYAYTMEDLWSMEVLGIRPGTNPLLDRIPITPESGSRVHLVLFGSGAQAESLAVHSALVAHYPNYCRDNRLRTRITWVSDSMTDFARFKQQYKGLLENSWRRNLTISGDDVKIDAAAPKYANERQDFIDVEWEFVEARGSDDIFLYKLARWSNDEDKQLTVALCYEDDGRNINEALAMKLPDSVPVLVRVDDDASLMFLKQSGQFGHIIPMGMKAADLPSMTDFIHMAQCVNYAYFNMRESTEDERRQGAAEMNVALELPSPEELQGLWNSPKLTTAKRWSNIYNAFTVNTKMRSLTSDDAWDIVGSIAPKSQDVNHLARVAEAIVGLYLGWAHNLYPIATLALFVDAHSGGDKLTKILVGGDHIDVVALCGSLVGQGADNIVGLVALNLQHGDAHSRQNLLNIGHCSNDILGVSLRLALYSGKSWLRKLPPLGSKATPR